MEQALEFRILGPLDVRLAGHNVEVAGGGQRALLARLLLDEGTVMSVEQLIVDLWVSPPSSGVRALHQRMAQLRQMLDRGGIDRQVVETRGAGYVVELQSQQLDLHRFESFAASGDEALVARRPEEAVAAFQDALALWRGAPLAEFPDAPFATTAGGRLGELRLAVFEKRLDAELALGRHLDAIGDLEELAAHHPFREGFRAQLMLALYRAGRQAEALAAYQDTRRVLVEELGVEPTGALQDLERAILRHDPALALLARTEGGEASPDWRPDSPERSILIVPSDTDNLGGLLSVGEPLTRRPPRELILTALAPTAAELTRVSASLEAERRELPVRNVPARAAAFTTESLGTDIVRLASAQDVDLLLTDAPAELLAAGVLPPPTWR